MSSPFETHVRAGLFFTLLAAVALMFGAAIGRGGPWIPAVRDGVTVIPQPNPTHVEWDHYPVGGLWLAKPEADSLGHHSLIVIPEGSVLSVPRIVEGPDPDSLRAES